ncbi:hypothetical protein VNI00_002538 [Paramarasmius palmivorus]|uniref:Uncharacterized protein n=1 Tax=Paramarasmius palmivorus TaxID=297713 RepID=A0AAW0DXP3_9AGAR
MDGLASSNKVADEEHAGDVMLGTVWSYEEVRLKDGTEDAGDGGPLSDSSFSVSDEGMWKIDWTRFRTTRLENDAIVEEGVAIHNSDEKAEDVGVKAPKASVRFTDEVANGDEDVMTGVNDARLAGLTEQETVRRLAGPGI